MSTEAALYPLLFEDLFKEKIWGGRRLETELGRRLPPGRAVGESWEVSDRDPDISVVANGPLRGVSLHQLLLDRQADLLGTGVALGRFRRFPLLIKFIDASRVLSVQVHPPDEFARRHDPHDDGKTEMFYILGTEPGAVLYLGLRPGVTRGDFEHALEAGGVADLLRPVEVAPGDCIAIPPGTLHAPGAGLLFAEVQQHSDLTYRVYDWDRLGADGRPRPLDLEKALAVIDWEAPKEEKVTPQVLSQDGVRKEFLVRCPKFTAERWTLGEPVSESLNGRFRILMALEGEADIAGPGGTKPVLLSKGRSALLPASLGEVDLQPQGRAVLLVAYRAARVGQERCASGCTDTWRRVAWAVDGPARNCSWLGG